MKYTAFTSFNIFPNINAAITAPNGFAA